MKRVVIVGLGYVGLPLAIRAAKIGHQVVGYDTEARRVKLLDATAETVARERPTAPGNTPSARSDTAPASQPQITTGDVANMHVT